ncbi:putative cellulase precursor [Cercophora newfieldiana]|uniref:cellulase n=1 Tax=Cercophora newfieldiana TaxID=92897 RepID=A0AA39YR09_9PEZI|nr:putative cellulase precursor [Cercophora newfieldiana]
MRSSILAGAFATGALAQGGAWSQCGGNNWSGPFTCVSGYTCVYENDWYSQCRPGAAPTTLTTSTTSRATITSTTATTTSTTSSATASATAVPGKFKWFGVNQSGAEFGEKIYPGTWGKEFIFPSKNAIQHLIGQGYNIFRVCFSMERLVPNTLTGSFDAAYLRNLTDTLNYITNAGAYAVPDPHNYGRYFGNVVTDTNAFKTFFTNFASQLASNSRVVFDTNNEYHTMDQNLVLQLNQAAIDGIRAAGATSQHILVEGNQWSGAWSWNITNTNLVALTDPQNKLIYQMHQYLDSDSSGTSEACVSADIGVQRVVGATAWLRANGKQGLIGEFAGGANTQCKTAVTRMLDHLKANSDVWQGALWWAGGPWWGPYMYSFEPAVDGNAAGTGYSYYNDLLRGYVA